MGQIKEDLTTAASLLAEKSELTGSKGFEKGRATKGAAYALKAEVHLMMEEWQDAADASTMVINSPDYALYSSADYSKNFRGEDENGPESIFEIQYTDDVNAPGAFFNTYYGLPGFVQGNGRYGAAVTSDTSNMDFPGEIKSGGLLQEWEEGDIRRDMVMSNFGVENPIDPSKPKLWFCTKYFTGTATLAEKNSYANVTILRLARTMLTKAEALNELSGGSSEAVNIVNTIRNRAGLDNLPDGSTGDQDLLRKAIWKERRLELNFEGVRYFDLLRTGRYVSITEAGGITVPMDRVIQHPVTNKDWYLWPIPESEITTNPKIEQNPGY